MYAVWLTLLQLAHSVLGTGPKSLPQILIHTAKPFPIFGSTSSWTPPLWIAVNDQIRGGASTSSLTISTLDNSALFTGHLDTSKLGGAGFASYRTSETTSPPKRWDLTPFSGLKLITREGDGKRYSLNLITTPPTNRPDGRIQSRVEYKFSFVASEERIEHFAKWEDFKIYYRGRELKDDDARAVPLDVSHILAFDIMCQSYFDEQKGHFRVVVESVHAV
ncbi:hypothetical protein HK097_007068 [Rhizophlyctis rosea]|uniref:NADH:ubiquinone oxidoreductase intermediate-associated protein 30 domain-containing protein n=1 Tax=Rhizophlyctis rosea TaxID=64517 RepID=A0AAD5SDL8_9FUNG|nr:hypothetical protein HK097_007068 [Rhizophlyctis rosea]